MFSNHQFLEFLASLDVLVAEDVFDIFVTAGCRGQPVVHGVAAGLSKNMHEPKQLRCISDFCFGKIGFGKIGFGNIGSL